MITGGKITSAEVKIHKDGSTAKRSVNIQIKDMKIEKGVMTIDYEYRVTYGDDVATISIEGSLEAKEENGEKIVESWKKKKALPDDFAEEVLNVVNYVGSVNGTLIAKVVNLMPPLTLPKLVKKEKEGGKAM
jgi:hypothetical protein